MKKILQITIITFLIFVFNACGGGSDKATFDTGQQIIDITMCPIYIEVETNDLLVKDSDGTSIDYMFDSNGTKQICVVSGAAHIVREN